MWEGRLQLSGQGDRLWSRVHFKDDNSLKHLPLF